MKNLSLYCLLFALLLISCNRGVYVTIDNKKYDYGKKTIVRLLRQEGTPIGYGLDIIYGPTFIITSLTKKRAKGYFKSKLVDTKADTAKPSNTIYVEGRFNVSLKNAQHY